MRCQQIIFRYQTCHHVVYTWHTIASMLTEQCSCLKQQSALSPIMFTLDNNAKNLTMVHTSWQTSVVSPFLVCTLFLVLFHSLQLCQSYRV
jgi:hypothetical protein